ncbi:MAG: hypothetical protein DYG89_41780 [Caldilinea sp. CFX5]|nr:hypothetical protein [Caldilinea sp. CFX5]
MPSARYGLFRLLIPFIIFLLGCPPPAPTPPPEVFVEEAPADLATGIAILGATDYLAPASKGSLLVQLHAPYSSERLPDTRVRVTLNTPNGETRELFTGQTDKAGLVHVTFDVPATVNDPNQVLTVVADSTNYGQLQTSQEVYVGRVYNVLLSTDKPVYQPGQVIHLRTLALDTTALKAAQEQPLVLTVADPAGNKLMRKELTTSAFGIASADFQLDSQAASGDYVLTAEMGPVTSSRTVEVKPYTLPRFEITFQSAKAFYLPGEVITGTVDAQYFFGKPVAGGQVRIKGFVTDVERVQLFELTGTTDAAGFYAYEFQTPDTFVGQLENDTAQVDLEITVIDTANHSEQVDESVTIAEKSILIEAIPEAGFLRPGLENIVYLQTSYPDGRAAATTIRVDGVPTTTVTNTVPGAVTNTVTVTTDEFGLATIRFTPVDSRDLPLVFHAVDSTGQAAEQTVTLGGSGDAQALLLRPEKVQYQIGETLNVDIHVAGQAQTAYLDIIKGRQTFGLAALPVAQGVAQAAIDLDGSLLGTLELNAYVITDQGQIVRDRRLVLVNPAPAAVAIQADADVYRPGDTATLDITVQREGAPMPGVLGLSIVDESVFAVGAQEPGFARTYFLLDRELQEPRYEIHDFSPLQSDDPSPYDRKNAGHAQQLALAGFFAEELVAMGNTQHVTTIAHHVPQTAGNARSALAWGWANRIALVLPLMGIAFYDGTRRRRHLFLGLVLLSLAFFWTSCAAPAAPMAGGEMAAAPAAEAPAQETIADATTATQGNQSQPPRLRQFFPETLFWLPELTTDANGHAQVQVPIADSITTWRISVLASDQAGHLGSAEVGMKVFQDFFVEPDLPRFLTVGDEVAVPVSIFNYLDEAQEINLEVAQADWFAFVETPTLRFTVAPNEVMAAYLPIRVTNFGQHEFQVTATGSAMSDAVLRQVEVLPDGKAMAVAASGKLTTTQRFALDLPPNAVPGTGRVAVKIYPGVISQVIDGLEGMLQQPYGCFEQTSSTTYPNVMVLDYLKTTNQVNPRIQLQAEQYINLGYQRLLSFEVRGMPGGFSLFGDPPPQTMLTAYGLMEFTDMSQVSYVDPALIERTAIFLFQRQQGDGSWAPEGMTIESGLEGLGNSTVLPTAYVTWALADAGYATSEPVQRAVAYLHGQLAQYLQAQTQNNQANSPLATPPAALDPYAAAMLANALIAADPQGSAGQIDQLISHLLSSAEKDTQGYFTWSSGMTTYMGGYGNVSNIETAAMTAIALLRVGQHLDVAQGAIDSILSQRDPNGMFYSTQTTVLALKALLLAAEQGGQDGPATVTVTINGDRAQTLTITEENADVVQLVSFDDLNPNGNEVTITVEGERALQYQVVTQYYLPWEAVPSTPAIEKEVRIDVAYDRTELQVNDLVNVTAEVELLAPGVAGTLLVDLGIPPGFRPLTEDLDGLVAQGLIARYELTGRQILVYMTNVPSGQVYRLPYRLQARFPIRAQTPSSQAYDYYTPEKQDTATPQRIVVKLGTPGQ